MKRIEIVKVKTEDSSELHLENDEVIFFTTPDEPAALMYGKDEKKAYIILRVSEEDGEGILYIRDDFYRLTGTGTSDDPIRIQPPVYVGT